MALFAYISRVLTSQLIQAKVLATETIPVSMVEQGQNLKFLQKGHVHCSMSFFVTDYIFDCIQINQMVKNIFFQ